MQKCVKCISSRHRHVSQESRREITELQDDRCGKKRGDERKAFRLQPWHKVLPLISASVVTVNGSRRWVGETPFAHFMDEEI